MNKTRFFRHKTLWLAAILLAMPVHAQAAANGMQVPVAHGSVYRDYARITFEWPNVVYFKTSAQGRMLSITFDRKANPDLGPLLKSLSPYVIGAQRKKDGKTIVLTLDRPYRIRTFVSDNINGIDLLDIRKPPAATQPKTAIARAETKEPPPARELSALAPAAGGEAPPVQPTDAEVLATGQPVAQPASGRLKVGVSPAADSAILRFPFAERTALSVFHRAHVLWVVFNRPMELDLADFDALPATVLGQAQLVSHPKATVLRMQMDDNAHVQVAREENSFSWAVLVTLKKNPPDKPLKVDVNTEPPAPAHVFIPTLEMADPVIVNDPQVGDELVVVPLYSPGEGMAVARDFAEFSLPGTAQGIVVNKKADEVQVVQLRNGLRISMPQGATLTSGLPELSMKSANAAASFVTLFPYEKWRSEETAPFKLRQQKQELFQRIVESANPQDASEARLRLAQMYLSDGMAAEALGLLDGINRTNTTFYRTTRLNALRGAANFLMYRFVESARDFAAPELNNNKEINYWRAMLSDLLGNPDRSYDYLGMNDDYISKYPPLFRQQLGIVAADRAIDAKEYNKALKIFDKLHQGNLLSSINAYINYLLAKVSASTGQEKEALEMWDKLAADSTFPFVQARAEFSRIAWGMEHNALTNEQAIDRLERLRLGWHGDGLELQVLTILGDLYANKKDFVNAMRIWHGGIGSFPNTGQAIDMSRKMQEAFIVMFNEGVADQLPPLEALALYYQYRNYTPPGSVGNEMIERLADRLVGVDLLEQASALLDHQMRFQTEKEQRSRIGAKLASVYLLNHQSQKALQALQDSMYGENPLMLRLQRNRITAQAMVDLGQSDKAMQTLGADNSTDAERIRLSIYWRERDWQRLTTSIEGMLKARPDITAPMTLDESEYLLKLALAYVFQNNTVQLQYLQDYFGPLMAGSPNKPVFDFITGGNMQLTTTNFDELLKYLADTRSFIDNYHAHLQMTGGTTPTVVK